MFSPALLPPLSGVGDVPEAWSPSKGGGCRLTGEGGRCSSQNWARARGRMGSTWESMEFLVPEME